MKQKLLIIDGMYFFQRTLGQLNMGDSVNNLQTTEEQKAFKSAVANSLLNLWNTFSFNNLIDNLVFVTDCGSWRKDVEPFRPYFIPETSDQVIGYKEQRKAKKEESPINYDNFYKLCDEFIEEMINQKLIVFNIHKLEGDDNLMLISNKLSKENVFGVIFGTDGDLDQIVKNNIVLMRNIRSKDAPNGEYVITLDMYTKIFEASAIDNLLGAQFDNKYYKDLFSILIGCTDGSNSIKRELNRGISIATPFKTALIKSVAGDKKDNIFSLISWKSSTGTRNYNITEKYIAKALDKHGYSLTESNCQKILGSKENLLNLMYDLKSVTKQKDVDVKELINHLRHNLKINMLSVKNVPEEYRNQFDTVFESYKEQILNEKLDVKKLQNLCSINNRQNNGYNVLEDSIPEL